MAPKNMLPYMLNPDNDYPKKDSLWETYLHRR